MSPQDDASQIRRPLEKKVEEDTEKKTAEFMQMRQRERSSRLAKAKVKIEVTAGKSEKKELSLGEIFGSKAGSVFDSDGSNTILLGLGLTIGLVNDFSDLATWQSMNLMSSALDIVALFLLLFVLTFASRTYFIAVVIILLAFVLEILPVVGIVPWWTIGVITWYAMARRQ